MLNILLIVILGLLLFRYAYGLGIKHMTYITIEYLTDTYGYDGDYDIYRFNSYIKENINRIYKKRCYNKKSNM